MPVTITRAQRDAIYGMVIMHLSAIGDVWLSVKRRDFADAKEMGRKFAEDLRLLEDLGWPEAIERETVTLTMPAGERLLGWVSRRSARRRPCLSAMGRSAVIGAGVPGVAGCRTAGLSAARPIATTGLARRRNGCAPGSSTDSSSTTSTRRAPKPWGPPQSPTRSGARRARWATA
jgi:hypothetical protein